MKAAVRYAMAAALLVSPLNLMAQVSPLIPFNGGFEVFNSSNNLPLGFFLPSGSSVVTTPTAADVRTGARSLRMDAAGFRYALVPLPVEVVAGQTIRISVWSKADGQVSSPTATSHGIVLDSNLDLSFNALASAAFPGGTHGWTQREIVYTFNGTESSPLGIWLTNRGASNGTAWFDDLEYQILNSGTISGTVSDAGGSAGYFVAAGETSATPSELLYAFGGGDSGYSPMSFSGFTPTDSTTPYEGTFSMRAFSDPAGSMLYAFGAQTITLPTASSEPITFTAWVKGEDVGLRSTINGSPTRAIGLSIVAGAVSAADLINASDMQQSTDTGNYIFPGYGTYDWRRVQTTLIPSGPITDVTFGLWFREFAQGTLYVDAITVSQGRAPYATLVRNDGSYSLDHVNTNASPQYTVRATKTGQPTHSASGVTVQDGQTSTVNLPSTSNIADWSIYR